MRADRIFTALAVVFTLAFLGFGGAADSDAAPMGTSLIKMLICLALAAVCGALAKRSRNR